MSTPRIGRNASSLVIDQARIRQTPRPPSTFTNILKGSADVLLSGASTASKVVGLPVVSAALAKARLGTATSNVNASTGGGSPGSQDELLGKALEEQKNDDLKLLALQSEIQRQNRQVSLVSNLMKSRHDTAKAAIGNMRS